MSPLNQSFLGIYLFNVSKCRFYRKAGCGDDCRLPCCPLAGPSGAGPSAWFLSPDVGGGGDSSDDTWVLSVLFLSLQEAVTIPGSLLEGLGSAQAWGTSPTCHSPCGEIWRLCPSLSKLGLSLMDSFVPFLGYFPLQQFCFLLTFQIKCFYFSEIGNSVSGCSLHQKSSAVCK